MPGRTVRLWIGFVLIAVLGVCAWRLWSRPKSPPAATADQVYAAVTAADPLKMTEAERTEWAATVGSALDRLPPQEVDALLKKTVADPEYRERFRALDPEDRKKFRERMTDDQKAGVLIQMVKKLKEMTPEEQKAFFEKGRAAGFGRGGPGESAGQSSESQPSGDQGGTVKGPRGAPTGQRAAQRIASHTPLQRFEFRQAMAAMRQMRQQAGVGGGPPR